MNTFIKPLKEDFIKYYNAHTGIETAAYFNIDPSTACKYARQYKIPRRHFKYKELPETFTNRQIEIINGSMLGDACLEKLNTKKCNSRFIEKHGIKQEEYLKWKFKELKPFTETFGYGEEITFGKKHKYCKFNTFNCPCFTILENKWYNEERIKIIPNDLVLTPLTLAVWYFDDGYNYNEIKNEKFKNGKQKLGKKNIWLFTNGFAKSEVDKLITMLKNIGISKVKVTNSDLKRGSKPQIYIGAESYFNFLDIVNPHNPCKCLEYKLRKEL